MTTYQPFPTAVWRIFAFMNRKLLLLARLQISWLITGWTYLVCAISNWLV